MRCYEIQDVLTEFIEGSLPREQTREVVDHIARCKACERDLRRMENLIASLRSLPPIEPPSRLRPSISDALRSTAQQESARVGPVRRRYMWVGGGLGAAAAAAVFLGIIFALRPSLLGVERPMRVAELSAVEEGTAEEARDRVASKAPVIELGPEEVPEEAGEEPNLADVLSEGADDALGEAEQGGLDGDVVGAPGGRDAIGARAEALTEAIRGRSLSLGIDALKPAPDREVTPGRPFAAQPPQLQSPAQERPTTVGEMDRAEAGGALAQRMKASAPPPPSARGGGLWQAEQARSRVARTPGASATAEDAEAEEAVRIASGGYGGGGAATQGAPASVGESRMAFEKSERDVQLDVRRAAPLRVGEPGELIVTIHANRDVEDAKVTLDAPKGVRLAEAAPLGVLFRGKLGKETTKTIRVPVVPEESGTKMFKAEATHEGRGAVLARAETAIPVDVAMGRPAARVAMTGARGPAGERGPAGLSPDEHTLAFKDVDLRLALRQAAAETGAKVQIAPDVPNMKITYSPVKKTIAEIMKALAAKGGCQAALKDNVWHIARGSGGE